MTMSSSRIRANTLAKASLLASASIVLLFAIIAAPAARAFHSPSATAAVAAIRRRSSERRRRRLRDDGIAVLADPPRRRRPRLDGAVADARGIVGLHSTASSSSGILLDNNRPTELPDSLEDAASIAANACHQIRVASGTTVRCRVDFDTSVGDETYTLLKSSTEFTQNFLSALCLASVDGVMDWRMDCASRLANARAELVELRREMEGMGGTSDVDDENDDGYGDFLDEDGAVVSIDDGGGGGGGGGEPPAVVVVADEEALRRRAEREAELLRIVADEGRAYGAAWTGPKVRVYFPDEGSAALARRDWTTSVPPCVEFASCGGVQASDTSSDAIVLFCCPRASEAESVERILYGAESDRGDGLLMSVMLNPLLVDMGVTGFGMAGRRLRERLIDGLVPAYYLRTLPWGALTRVWPRLFTVWKEDENAEGGYTMIQAMDRLPSNPEVEDIFDISNGDMSAPKEGFGFLNSLGDFVNGMMRL